MYDRPTASELLAAARDHIEQQIIPAARATNHKLYFQTLVAVNVLRIVERELGHRNGHMRAAWTRLNMLLGGVPFPDTSDELEKQLAGRNAELCSAIRAGDYDTNGALFEHLKASTIDQLEVANPKFLATLQAEDAATR